MAIDLAFQITVEVVDTKTGLTKSRVQGRMSIGDTYQTLAQWTIETAIKCKMDAMFPPKN